MYYYLFFFPAWASCVDSILRLRERGRMLTLAVNEFAEAIRSVQEASEEPKQLGMLLAALTNPALYFPPFITVRGNTG